MLSIKRCSLLAGIFACCNAISTLAETTSKSQAFENYISQNSDVGLRINLDSNRFDGIYREDRLESYQYDSQVRRARLSLKLPLGSDWSTKIQVAINEDEDSYETKDLYFSL